MEKILVTIAQASDGSYWCHAEQGVYGGGLNGWGMSVSEAKEDLEVCLAESRADYEEHGGKPYDVEFRYQYDLKSFFEYFSFLNASDIARRAGINPSLMRQYTSGVKNAGEKTYARLSECMEKIKNELQASTFCVQ